MQILHVCRHDISGGAARAGYRIHHALRAAGIDSRMRVIYKSGSDSDVIGGPAQQIGKMERRVRSRLSQLPLKLSHPVKGGTHSAAWPATGLGKELDSSDADILNLHWIGTDTLSIEEIGRLKKPLVWRLADMWMFCGAEHYAEDTDEAGFKTGYMKSHARAGEGWFDLNRWTWNRKMNSWQQPFDIVCTSRWMEQCARKSRLLRDWPITVIPNALDLAFWRPMEQRIARRELGLNPSENVVLFGAPGGLNDPRKGADLAISAIRRMADKYSTPTRLVVFGSERPEVDPGLPMPTTFLGRIEDDHRLLLAYNAADLFIMPSRLEAFGQTASEALACGTPVIAFKTGGLPDIVDHRKTGWLAKPFDIDDLAAGMEWGLSDKMRLSEVGKAARVAAKRRFSEEVVSSQYIELYSDILERNATGRDCL